MDRSTLYDEPKSLATAIDQSGISLRPYTRQVKPNKYYIPEYARFKLWVKFADGRKMTRYSYDEVYSQEKQQEIRDEFNGLVRLINLLGTYKEVKTAIIYASDCPIKKAQGKTYNIEIYKLVKNYPPTKNPYTSFLPCGTIDLKRFNSSNLKLSRK